MCKLCKQCPFRECSPLGFDQDGLDCIDRGLEPSCHEIVGAGKQFNDAIPPKENICRGFLNWKSGKNGFHLPFLEVET